MPGAGFLFRSRRYLKIIGNPSPQKPFYPIDTLMNILVVLLATFDVLIWGYNAVKIAGIIWDIHLAING
jgi:hypothetical protein